LTPDALLRQDKEAVQHDSPPSGAPLAILLAAGIGSRLRSSEPKAMARLAGRPMILGLIDSCRAAGVGRIVVVVGPGMPQLEATVSPHETVVQIERLGTAHAALQAADALASHPGDAAILYADNPLVAPSTIRSLFQTRLDRAAGLAMLAFEACDPGRYGRVVTDQAGLVERIVEWADASATQRAIPLCNAGVFAGPARDLLRWLGMVRPDNQAREYYLTDLVGIARAEGASVVHVTAPEAEVQGINTRSEQARAEASLQSRLRDAAMAAGAHLVAPETVFLCHDTRIAADAVIHPHVIFGPGVTVDAAAEILSFSHLEGAHVRSGARIGPMARLRPGTDIGEGAHVGNWVEVKATTLGAGAKANHLAYLGDSEIGERTNVGAGTITCNYDGRLKHRTTIGPDVFVGSHATLVAPVTIGPGAFIAAGSTITEEVPPGALAFGRARQVNKGPRKGS